MTASREATITFKQAAKRAAWFAIGAALITAVAFVLIGINPMASLMLGPPIAVAVGLGIAALIHGVAALMLLASSWSKAP